MFRKPCRKKLLKKEMEVIISLHAFERYVQRNIWSFDTQSPNHSEIRMSIEKYKKYSSQMWGDVDTSKLIKDRTDDRKWLLNSADGRYQFVCSINKKNGVCVILTTVLQGYPAMFHKRLTNSFKRIVIVDRLGHTLGLKAYVGDAETARKKFEEDD